MSTPKPDGFTIARQLVVLKAFRDTLLPPAGTVEERTLKHEMLIYTSIWQRALEAMLAESEVTVGFVEK